MRQRKDKDSTVHTTANLSKINPKVKPRFAQPKTQHQVLTLSSIDTSLSPNRHRVKGQTRWCVSKEESKVSNHDWVDHQACSMLQCINSMINPIRNYFNKLR